MSTTVIIGAVMLAFGLVLLRVGMPNSAGKAPQFMQNSFVQMLYPVACLTFIVLGVALGSQIMFTEN